MGSKTVMSNGRLFRAKIVPEVIPVGEKGTFVATIPLYRSDERYSVMFWGDRIEERQAK